MLFFASRELIPLYGLYAVLFRERGVSAGQMSVLFVIWSAASFVFEIPSGAWADTTDPRRMLALSGVLKATGFGCWLCWPSIVGFAAGFLLWALSSATVSGTFEAYVYGSLHALGRADRYPTCIGRAHAVAQLAVLVAIAAGAPLFDLGGFQLAAGVSIAMCAVSVRLALLLPPPPVVSDVDALAGTHSYVATLRVGLAEARFDRGVRRALLIASAAVGLTAFDEYFPLVASEHGATGGLIPLLVSMTTIGQVVGTALAGRAARLGRGVLAAMYGSGGMLLAAGALLGGVLGFALVGAGFGLLNNVMLVTEARLQTRIRSHARATVTSVGGMSTEIVALTVYAGFGVSSTWWTTTALLTFAVVPATAIAALIARRLPDPQHRRRS